MRTIRSIPGNTQRLDGGAMFGNVPKALWSRWAPADEHNRIALACRAMLVEEPGRRVLCETGIGAFFPPKLRARFGVEEDRHVLLDSLAALGLTDADIEADRALRPLGIVFPYRPEGEFTLDPGPDTF